PSKNSLEKAGQTIKKDKIWENTFPSPATKRGWPLRNSMSQLTSGKSALGGFAQKVAKCSG
ncbi:MAG TPA: hypothetical protein VJG90_06985, partial [Candidatus Nanoarchaeia archaeon]|nr:hypothetical protein [Candidatus Nanoarchaeia archaeon]